MDLIGLYDPQRSAAFAIVSVKESTSKAETYSKVAHLPVARSQQDYDLRNCIPCGTGVGGFTQVPVLGLSFSLVLLLPPNVLQPSIEVPELLSHFTNVLSVMFCVVLCSSDVDVEVHPYVSTGEPPRCVVGAQADGMITSFVRCESKFALWWTSSLDNGVAGLHFLRASVIGSVASAQVKGLASTLTCTPSASWWT